MSQLVKMKLFFVFLLVVASVSSQEAGAKATLSKAGLGFLRDAAYKFIEKYVHGAVCDRINSSRHSRPTM